MRILQMFCLMFFVFLLSCTHIMSTQTNKQNCHLSNNEREDLMKLDYQSFDQTLPDGGWRKYQLCLPLVCDLLDEYIKRHNLTLKRDQKRILIWHSGQISGFLKEYDDAINKMQQTLKDIEKKDDDFLWNPYVKATIAFLKKDHLELLKQRKKLSYGTSPFNHMNLRIVDSFIRCSESDYQDAYTKNCIPEETDADRISSTAVKLSLKSPWPSGVVDFLLQKKIILVGEVHGTVEMPQLFGEMVVSLSQRNNNERNLVILEIDQSSQTSIDNFLKTGKKEYLQKEPFFYRQYQDGRSSQAMVWLLEKLSKIKNIKVLCMDPLSTLSVEESISGQERDLMMAKFIMANLNDYNHIWVLSGNIHSSLSVGTPWEKDYRPMGFELKQMMENSSKGEQIFNILIRSETLNSWSCFGPERESCKIHNGKKSVTDYSSALNWNSYFLWEDSLHDGHWGTLFVRRTKASLPLIYHKWPTPPELRQCSKSCCFFL